jgi:hypothetical protein
MTDKVFQNGQLEPKENPVNARLVKDSKTSEKANSADVLEELIHRAVTFTPDTLDRDTAELNKAITHGYEIHDYVRTETGIVYILAKWRKQQKIKPNDFGKKSLDCSLKDCYKDFCKRNNQ